MILPQDKNKTCKNDVISAGKYVRAKEHLKKSQKNENFFSLSPNYGTSVCYLCPRKVRLTKIVNNNVNKKSRDMKNTDYSSVNGIQSIISSESSFSTLLDIIGDLGLEVISVTGEE